LSGAVSVVATNQRGRRDQLLALRGDRVQQLPPRGVERVLALLLEPVRERVGVDAGAVELLQHLLGVAAVGRQRVAHLAVIGEGEQGLVRHRIDGERRRERLDVEHVRSLRVLRAGACPQQPLRACPLVCEALEALRIEQLAVGAVGAFRNRDPELAAQRVGRLVHHGLVPAADEQRRHRWHVRVHPGLDAALEAAHVCVGGAEVLVGREKQRDVDRDAIEDRLLDRLATRVGTRDLDVDVALGSRVQVGDLRDRPFGVVGQQR
jgi:hypothetical protein